MLAHAPSHTRARVPASGTARQGCLSHREVGGAVQGAQLIAAGPEFESQSGSQAVLLTVPLCLPLTGSQRSNPSSALFPSLSNKVYKGSNNSPWHLTYCRCNHNRFRMITSSEGPRSLGTLRNLPNTRSTPMPQGEKIKPEKAGSPRFYRVPELQAPGHRNLSQPWGERPGVLADSLPGPA